MKSAQEPDSDATDSCTDDKEEVRKDLSECGGVCIYDGTNDYFCI